MRKKANTNKLNRLAFKKRTYITKKTKQTKNYGAISFFVKRTSRIEGVYIKKLKLKLKKAYKKKKRQSRPKNFKASVWFKYALNTTLTKKSTNARMGSGKGKLIRRAFTAYTNTSIIEIKSGKKSWCTNITKYMLRKWSVRVAVSASKLGERRFTENVN